MKLEVTIQLLRFCSQVFNCIFLVLGLSVAGSGIWILFGRGSLLTSLSSDELSTVGVGLLLIGGVVLLVSVIGCAGVHRENRLLLLVYLSFLVVLVLGQLFITMLLLINRDKIERSLDEKVDQIILQYRDNDQDRLVDELQKHGQCCGRTGPADWLENSYILSLNLTSPHVLPCSCFKSYHRSFNSPWCSQQLNVTDSHYGQGNGSYEQGCKKQLSDWLQENALTIISMDVGLVLIQVLQFVFMVYLYRAFGRKAALKSTSALANSDHAHLDHTHSDHTPLDHTHSDQAYLDHAHLDHTPGDDLGYVMQNYGYIDPDEPGLDYAHPAYYQGPVGVHQSVPNRMGF